MDDSSDSPFDPSDFATFRRQETTLLVLNLGVLAGLTAIHLAFIGLLGPPPRLLLVVLAARFIEQTLWLAWLQGRVDPVPPRLVRAWSRFSVWEGMMFAVLVVSLGAYEDSHYAVLFILPLLSAAFRFSLPGALALTALAGSLTVGQIWLAGRVHSRLPASEYFEAVTMALVYAVVTPLVAMLVRGLHRRELDVRARADELQRTRERLLAEEKFAAIGRLAGAVAHEIRNPVAVITSSLATATRLTTSGPVREELFGIAAREAGRLERVTTDFLLYARPRRVEPRVTNVASALAYVCDLLRSRAEDRDVAVRVNANEGLLASFDAFQVHQALLNLGINAVEATAPGGTVTLRASIEGDTLTLAVENPGPRIPVDVAERLFEPFFTTRPDGTGLGLSIARSIAQAHGGDARLASNGTAYVRFELLLPIEPPAGDPTVTSRDLAEVRSAPV